VFPRFVEPLGLRLCPSKVSFDELGVDRAQSPKSATDLADRTCSRPGPRIYRPLIPDASDDALLARLEAAAQSFSANARCARFASWLARS
jgi:hypothetical protein